MSWLGTRSWCKRFFDGRGLTGSQRCPLYAYRTTDGEFEELGGQIRLVSRPPINPDRLSSEDCALFCLYAAEWWRRNHEAGPWKWEGILEAINWGGTPLNKLYPIVRSGLHYWKRDLLRTKDERNLFLVTLACEGGLPLRLLRRETARLRSFFRDSLEEFHYFHRSGEAPAVIVARLGDRLPRSLRHEVVYQLAGSLVQKIWELQRKVGDSKTPVEDLDRLEPGWREEMPLRVEDDTARLLLRNLIEDASRVASSVSGAPQVVARISQNGQAWELEAELKLPPKAGEQQVAELFRAPAEEIPPRLQLEIADADGDRTACAIISRYSSSADSAFVFESLGGGSIAWTGVKAALSRKLIGRLGHRYFEASDLKGGSGLGPLPWVFVPTANEEGIARFVGEGTVRTRHPEVYVAVLEGEKVSGLEELGCLHSCGRKVYRVCGEARFASFDGDCVVRSGQRADATCEFYLEGEKLAFAGEDSPYLGMPTLRAVTQSGIASRIQNLEWREDASSAEWLAGHFEGCVGRVWIRYRQGNELLYRARIAVVPKDTRIGFVPGDSISHGLVAIEGAGADSVGAEVPDGTARCGRDAKTEALIMHVQSVGEPPATFRCELRWRNGAHLSLRLPFPARGGRFVRGDGRVLPNQASLCVEHVTGVRAEALYAGQRGHFVIDGQMYASDASSSLFREMGIWKELREESEGRSVLALQDLDESLRLMLAMTQDLDAAFRLRLQATGGKGIPERILSVKRFDASSEWDQQEGCVFLNEDAKRTIGDTDLESLRLEARLLSEPGLEPEVLEQIELGSWKFSTGGRKTGPWLVTGWTGNWCRLRPLLCEIAGPGSGTGVQCSETATGIANAIGVSDSERREALFKDLFNRLAVNARDPEWEQFDEFVEGLRGLPPVAIDLLRFLATIPEASALALVRCNESRFEFLWSTMETMPFCWRLVPLRVWTFAARRHIEAFAGDSLEVVDLVQHHVLGVFRDRIPARIKGSEVIGAWIAKEVFGVSGPAEDLQVLKRPALRSFFMNSICEAQERLLQIHAADRWPPGYGVSEWKPLIRLPLDVDFVWRESGEGAGFRDAVLNAPIGAALACLFGVELDRTSVYLVRRLREFDVEWFDSAYENAFKVGMGLALDGHEELLR